MSSQVTIAADDLRAHYGSEEFGHFEDAHLDLAIGRATATVDRYLDDAQQAALSEEAITAVILTLARAYAHDEQALGADHPVVREMTEALRWLQVQSDRISARAAALSGRSVLGITRVRSAPARLTEALEGMLP